MKDKFMSLLKTVKRDGITELIEYLQQTDFYSCVASTSYHCNHVGGLVEHSLNVCEYALKLKEAWGSQVSTDSIIICSLLHDV